MATRVFDRIKFCEHFWRGPPKEHSCQVWSKLAKQFGRRRCLKKLLTTHDGHITTLKAPLEHVVLRWAKKIIIKGLKVLKVALMERPWCFGTDRWSSPLYMTILLLCNWDSFGKQSWKKEKLIFFTQGFLPIRLKFNGSSHIWLVFSHLTSLQFSWANAVTCNWQLPTQLDLFIFSVDI